MREIKFRAWDKKKKVFVDSMFSTLQLKTGYPDVPHSYADDVILIQYTGIKDKKGKEIYEGDILKRTLGGEHWDNMEVWWSDALASWRICEIGKDHEYRMELHDDANSGGYKFEIIGNIYEN